MLRNSSMRSATPKGDWTMEDYRHLVKAIREKVGDGKVLLALSGGVDSSVCGGSARGGSRRPADLRIR